LAVGEFLLELAGEAVSRSARGNSERGCRRRDVPLLDFVEALEKGNRDEDDDCLLPVTDFEL
jgi:hypothetical protein